MKTSPIVITRVCGEAFLREDSLQNHSLHNKCEISSYKCEACGTSFRNLSNLEKHPMLHIGGRTFKCRICLQTFTLLVHLQKHVRIHTEESSHVLAKYSEAHGLKSAKSKRNIQCKECGKCFSSLGNLNRHLLTHTRERTFQCQICFKAFTQSNHLVNHFRTHTGKKTFQL